MITKKLLAEIAGWYGILAILAAYVLVSFTLISSDSLLFQLLNLTGAIGVMIISTYKKVVQSIVLNIFWAAVAVIAIIRIII